MLLKYFAFDEPNSFSNPFPLFTGTGPIITPTTNTDVELAHITLKHINANDRVLIFATVGWQTTPTPPNTSIQFDILRDGVVIYSTLSSAISEAGEGTGGFMYVTAGFMHAETGLSGRHKYTLAVKSAPGNGGTATIFGPVHLSGQVIDKNNT